MSVLQMDEEEWNALVTQEKAMRRRIFSEETKRRSAKVPPEL